MSLLGEEGFRRLAELNHANAVLLADKLASVPGVEVANDSFFNEFTVRLSKPAAEVVDRLASADRERRVLAGVPVTRLYKNRPELAGLMLVAATETNTEEDMDALVEALREELR